jgi:hypothetical protein
MFDNLFDKLLKCLIIFLLGSALIIIILGILHLIVALLTF